MRIKRGTVHNYHVYRVQNAFDVDAGPIAPWFNQVGNASQYVLMDGYVPDPNPRLDKNNNRIPNNTVRWLTGNGPNGSTGISNPYLVELAP